MAAGLAFARLAGPAEDSAGVHEAFSVSGDPIHYGSGLVRVIFKELPILGPESMLAAKASLAAQRQGAYLKFHQALMAAAEPITPAMVEGLASKLGLDVAKLKADMELPEIRTVLDKNMKL